MAGPRQITVRLNDSDREALATIGAALSRAAAGPWESAGISRCVREALRRTAEEAREGRLQGA